MVPFVREEKTLWEYLKTAGKPIVLYGTGDGADKIIACLEAEGLSLSGIFASDEFVRGQKFHGFTVRRYSELMLSEEAVIVLIAFASERAGMIARFYELARVRETYAPHVPVFPGDGTVTPAWINKYEAELRQVYDRLADEASRQVFAAVLNYRLSGKLSYLQACTTDRGEDLRKIFSFSEDETYMDLGAYDGDTVREFLDLTEGRCRKIYAVEPDPKNFKKLSGFAENSKIPGITCIRAGIWKENGILELTGNGGRQSAFLGEDRPSLRKKGKRQPVEVVSVDGILGDERADYLKFDVEGVEKEALEGAKGHLTPDGKGRLPKLLIAAYHHDEDIFALPLLLWKLQPGYRIYLRKHPYVPAWEINIFAV